MQAQEEWNSSFKYNYIGHGWEQYQWKYISLSQVIIVVVKHGKYSSIRETMLNMCKATFLYPMHVKDQNIQPQRVTKYKSLTWTNKEFNLKVQPHLCPYQIHMQTVEWGYIKCL